VWPGDRVTTWTYATDRAPVPLRCSTSQLTRTGALLVSSPAALDLPHALVDRVTLLIVTREGDRRRSCRRRRRTSLPWSVWCTCADTTLSPSSPPASASNRGKGPGRANAARQIKREPTPAGRTQVTSVYWSDTTVVSYMSASASAS